MIHHTAFFGDATYTFALTDTMIRELQHKTGVGIGALYQRVVATHFHDADMFEIIRCGLIGGGTMPAEAQRLVDTYAKDRHYGETYPLALDILDARWSGTPEPVEPAVWINQDDLHHAAATGDLAAALNQVPG
jgi:hypothetical protein